MPRPVVITADSSADLTPEVRAEFAIHFMPIYICLEDRVDKDGVDIFPEDIYAAHRERGAIPKTAAPSLAEYQAFFESFTKQGADVVHISLSHKFSSCYQVAALAAAEVEGAYVVDSMNFCTSSGMLCVQAAKLRDQGLSGAEVAERLCVIRGKVRGIYMLDNLTFFAKSGRFPPVVAMCATILNIHPSTTIDGSNSGVVLGKKYRGKTAQVREVFVRDCIKKFNETCEPELCFFVRTPDIPAEIYEPMNRLVAEGIKADRLITGPVGCAVTAHVGESCWGIVGMDK